MNPRIIPALTPRQLKNFEAKIERIPFSECWLWSGARTNSGYGMIRIGDPGNLLCVLSHRLMYTLHYGPIPDGLMVLHSCHQGHLGCVTPYHLKVGTNDDNMADRAEAGTVQRGQAHYNTNLTSADVRAIRAEYAQGGITQRALAQKYGVKAPAISLIIGRKNWRHID